MWSRRAFLQHTSLAAACMAFVDTRGAAEKTGPLGKPIGIQLFTVAAAAAKDFDGTAVAVEFLPREVLCA